MSTKSSPKLPDDDLPRDMRVVAYAGRGASRLDTRSRPGTGPGELLLRLHACGLCGTDLFKLTNDLVTPGTVLGHEIVGTVCSVGEGVEAFQPGDRVVVPHHVACGSCALCLRGSDTLCEIFRENLLEPGGFGEYVRVRPRAVSQAARKIPDSVADEAAIFMEPAACVLRGVWRAGLRAPEGRLPYRPVVVVVGAGSMGLLHLLVLRSVVPGVRVLVCDTREDRLETARVLGAEGALLPGDALRAAVEESTGGLGADAVFDTVGGSRVLASSLAMTREGGTVVLFAHAPVGDRADFELNPFFKNERRVVGTYSAGLEEQREIFDRIVAGELDASPLVTHRLPLERFDEAVDLCRALRALKVLLVP